MPIETSTRVRALLFATGCAALLSACGGTGLFNRDRPDEFAVQLTNTLNDLQTQRTTQQTEVLQEQRDQVQFMYATLEGDPVRLVQ
mgnify:CR=1 FL=1